MDGLGHNVRKHILMVRVPGMIVEREPWKVSTALNNCVIYRAMYLHEFDAYEYVIGRGDFPEKYAGNYPLFADVNWQDDHPQLWRE